MKKRCDICGQHAATFIAGIHVCPKHAHRLRLRGAEWVRWAGIEWAWVTGHGPDPRSVP